MAEQEIGRVVEPTREIIDVEFVCAANLEGTIFFTCQLCDGTFDYETADIHAVKLHKATHMTLKRVPIQIG